MKILIFLIFPKLHLKKYQGKTDLSRLITEYAEEAKASAFRDEFQKGRLMAFYEIFSLMQQHTDIFDIYSDKLGLTDITTEDELFVPLMMLKKAG